MISYTESLFAACVFGGLALMYSQWELMGTLLLALGTFTRSNGMINAGFILYDIFFSLYHKKNNFGFYTKKIALTTIVILPYYIFNYYGYRLYCTDNNTNIPREWCSDSFPNIYLFVQTHYW